MARVASAWKNVIAYAWRHPMARHDRAGTYLRMLRWQLRSRRAHGAIVTPWVNGAKLKLRNGQSGATGNLYYGLHEYADMAFLAHLLRPGYVFADIGANVGSYTVLAARVAGARVVSFEPVPETARCLRDNVAVNAIADLVTVEEVALGRDPGAARFTTNLDAMNHFADQGVDADADAITVAVDTLDGRLAGKGVVAMKVDVEGAEDQVFARGDLLLAEPQLAAIEVETLRPGVRQAIERAGFAQAWYDPRTRLLSDADNGLGQNNHLFVRNLEFIADRLRSAAPISFGRISL